MNVPRLLVTRPAGDAGPWLRGLAEHGLTAQALPLIDIAWMPPDDAALRRAHQRLAGCQAVMFVSGNAVLGFHRSDASWVGSHADLFAMETRAWSTGPGTTAALRQAGWPEARIDAPAADARQFDSEALWARVQASLRPGQRVLIVRGGDVAGRITGRDWLAVQLRAAGVEVDQVVSYRRAPPVWSAAQRALARAAAADGSVWLFSASEAIANLGAALPGQDWSRARALATHPRIEAAARAAGFGRVDAVRPTLAAVVASIESCA